ncbi:AraC-like ligand binding domain protein [Clostridium sp. C105KSO15]|nr:AraC-like ligand binding domain protein [Clostridium sp. C105KSO15]
MKKQKRNTSRVYLRQLGADNVALLTPFRKGHFQINGVEHYHPAFLVSEDAKQNLIYPQGFLIMDARKDYYTDRSYLDSFELRYTLEGEGFLEYNGRKYTLRPGEGYWIDCKKPHYYGTTDTNGLAQSFISMEAMPNVFMINLL